jgi:hypothetical protein
MHTGGASSFPSLFLVPVRGDYVLLIEMEAINIYFEPMRKFTRTMQTSDKIHLFVYLPNMVACYNNLPNLLDAIKNLATNKKKETNETSEQWTRSQAGRRDPKLS